MPIHYTGSPVNYGGLINFRTMGSIRGSWLWLLASWLSALGIVWAHPLRSVVGRLWLGDGHRYHSLHVQCLQASASRSCGPITACADPVGVIAEQAQIRLLV